nr:MAG TPA: hypothetical protein [Crassvirales sp.]
MLILYSYIIIVTVSVSHLFFYRLCIIVKCKIG